MEAADEVLARLARGASAPYLGEPVSQLAHALQCAHLAEEAGADHALIAAALVHDIGHGCDPEAIAMGELGAAAHETIGAAFLRSRGFPDEVAALVEGHVAAKRWLVARRPGYAEKLSEASRATLVVQGGAMDDDEAAAFEKGPRFKDLVRLRAWDEQGKRAGWDVPGLDRYRPLVAALLSKAGR